MDIQPLLDAGLTEAQALAYSCLIEHSPIAPPELASLISETRTNTYKILEQLEEQGLARREDIEKKIHYWALSPTALLTSVDEELHQIEQRKRSIESSMTSLQDTYLEHNKLPGLTQYQGVRGLEKVLQQQITDSQEIHYIRSFIDHQPGTYELVNKYRHMARENGIHRYGLTQDISAAPKNHVASDEYMGLSRTWIDESEYSSPVEWAVFGDKVSVMAYGDEPVGLIIENKEVARSFKQMWDMMDQGIRRKSNYSDYPMQVEGTAAARD